MPLLIVQGNWEEAWELAETTRVDGSPLERQMAVMILGNLARMTGNRQYAWRMVGELLPRGPASEPEDGLFPYAIETLRLASRLALDNGDTESARSWIATHDRWLDWSGAARGRAESALLRAWLYLIDGDHESARVGATDALDLASNPRQPLVLLECHEMSGLIELSAGNLDAAREQIECALALANACDVPYQKARVMLHLSGIQDRAGKRSEANALREEIEQIARPLQATPLLDALATRTEGPTANGILANLTARETEVLRLVAQGYTDAGVADALSISPRTVGQHLRSIYNKLDVPSRAAATRRAVEADLI